MSDITWFRHVLCKRTLTVCTYADVRRSSLRMAGLASACQTRSTEEREISARPAMIVDIPGHLDTSGLRAIKIRENALFLPEINI